MADYTPASPILPGPSESRRRSRSTGRSEASNLPRRRSRSRSSRNSRGQLSRSPSVLETGRVHHPRSQTRELAHGRVLRNHRDENADHRTRNLRAAAWDVGSAVIQNDHHGASRIHRAHRRSGGYNGGSDDVRTWNHPGRTNTYDDRRAGEHRSRSPFPSGSARRSSRMTPVHGHRCRSPRSRSPRRANGERRVNGEPFTQTLNNNHNITDLVSILRSMSNNSLDKLGSMNNTVPEFDPCKREQTMTMWIHKVNECATIYNWTEKQTVHFALPKLKGRAQRWYEGLSSVLFSWTEWQDKLLATFPSEENYGQMLSDMLGKRARYTDSLEEYYYDKLCLVNRCGITGRRAVECILHGIDDRSVRLGAEAAQFDDPNKLLAYLRNTRNIRVYTDRKPSGGLPPPRPQATPSLRPSRCGNCKKDGHYTSQCTQPIKKCTRCGRIGHEVEQCYAKVQSGEKKVMRVYGESPVNFASSLPAPSRTPSPIESEPNRKYFKTALVNGYPITSYIDFGSECSMIRLSEFKNIGTDYIVDNLPSLRGFGNSMVSCIGKKMVQIRIDDVDAELELLIVPDHTMHVALIIGQTFTEQSHIIVEKTSNCLEISQLDHLVATVSNKVNIYCCNDIKVGGVTVVSAYTDATFNGNIYVEGGVRQFKGNQYYVPSGLFRFEEGGRGHIVVNGLSRSLLALPRHLLLARGLKAREEIVSSVMTVQLHGSDNNDGESIKDSDINIGGNLTLDQKTQLLTLLNKHRKCFALTLTELGSTTIGSMSINLHDNEPVVYRPYRLAYTEKEKVREIISELLDNNIIRPSTSPYASPIVLVKKKTGELRLCIDYRALNNKTVKDNFPMPLIDDQLDVLSGNQFYSTLDLASGYYQVPIHETDRLKTGFVTPDGHYEFNRMPFGLSNAPATFQRIINQVLGSLRHKEAMAYLDDVIIPSKSFNEGIGRLEMVLDLFAQAGLTFKLCKCVFFSETVEYLGFEISSSGIRPGFKKIEAVERFPVPQNQHNVRQFLGLASFFRRFVPQFSVMARPLTQLLKKDSKWLWGTDQENSFRQLQTSLSQRPTLALYNPQAYTELHTDACKIGLAGILFQRDGHEALKPVAYFSRQTTPEEQNYSSYDLETLAVVASLQKFRVYLIGVPFKVVTDCSSLRATFQKRDMIPRVARWWEQMQEYNFSIEYRAGHRMTHVDALSRNPIQKPLNVLAITTNSDWLRTVQSADDNIQRIIGILSNPDMENATDIRKKYKLKNNKLFRITKEGDRWVVPKGVRWQVVKQNHDDVGHFALDKTLEKIKGTFWFTNMHKFVGKYVKSCLECAYAKGTGGKKPGELHPIEKKDTPFDTIHADHVGPFVRSAGGNMYILVLIDAFTRYIYLKPVKNTKSQTTIKVFKEYFGIFGVPRRIITDRGTTFTSDLFKKFVLKQNIKHVLNAVSTPRANGQVERYNRTLIESLTAKCVGSPENKWDQHLPDVQWGLNNTINRGINRTPSEALFGIKPYGTYDSRIRTELANDVTNNSNGQDLSDIREQINNHVRSYQKAQKERYDRNHLKPSKYMVGDLVRVERQVPATGSSKKLVPKYQGPYKVIKVYDLDRYQIEDTPLTRKGNRPYTTVVAVDKIKPWLNFKRPHDSSSDDNTVDDSE